MDVPEPRELTMGDDPDEATCPDRDCGEPIDYSMDECPNCGRPLTDPEDFEPPEPDWDSMPGGADDDDRR